MITGAYRFLLLGQGQSSPHGTCEPRIYPTSRERSSVSGLHYNLEDNFCCLVEGGYVVDSRKLYEDHFDVALKQLVSGPMADETLPPGMFCREWNKIEPYVEGMELRGFDFVSLDVFVSLWRKAGSRTGRRKGDTIEWDDGTVEAIKVGRGQ